jgi:hypothetical protein
MAEPKPKKKRLRGIASILWKFFENLNNNDYFKEKYKDTEVKLLINATDGRFAGIIIIDKGEISVESIPNKDKKELKKKKIGWNGKIEAETKMFLDIAMGKIPWGALIKKLLTGKIRGARKLLILIKLFNIIAYAEKKADEASQE